MPLDKDLRERLAKDYERTDADDRRRIAAQLVAGDPVLAARRLRRRLLAVAVAILLLTGLVVGGWYAQRARSSYARLQATVEEKRAAEQAELEAE